MLRSSTPRCRQESCETVRGNQTSAPVAWSGEHLSGVDETSRW